MKIVVMLTCFNRKDKTEKCINTIIENSSDHELIFIVSDASSTDGTIEMLKNKKKNIDIRIINCSNDTYYSKGMRKSIEYLFYNKDLKPDYVLLVNDDVEFKKGFLNSIIDKSKNKNSIIVGATCNENGILSYGGIKYLNKNSIKYRKIDINENDEICDTFNANCVLIPYVFMKKVGNIDINYNHGLGDFDYGLSFKRNNIKIFSSDNYVGICNNNSIKNTWNDSSLSMFTRITLKENIKGAPFRQWFYFLKKNFGILIAIRSSITPYIRIFLRK